MIHIATVHWNTDRWVPVQIAFLRRCVKSDFRLYGWLNGVGDVPLDPFYYACFEPVTSHAVKLNLLAEIILAAGSPDDLLIFLDGDAFPIADIEPLIRQHLPAHKLLAVQRLENNGDIQPHPCFCATTVGFWRQLRGDWKEGPVWHDRAGKAVTDPGGILLRQLADRRVDWLPLLRSNKVNLHPVFFGIYADVVYHHGAGFRKGESRADIANVELKPWDHFCSKVLPGYGRRARRHRLRKITAANDSLSEKVFQTIQQDPRFYTRFL
jgi:hypothetical protein